jgi:hypothetical protein
MDAARSGQDIAGRQFRCTARSSCRDFLAALIGAMALFAPAFAPATPAAPTVTVVEYRMDGNEDWGGHDRFFLTADPAEIAALDGGGSGGAWFRTGLVFPAYPDTNSSPGAVGVCRFFGTDRYRADGTRIGSDTHFYTADPGECEAVKIGYRSIAADGVSYPAWTYEGIAFAVAPPTAGSCPSGTSPLYRGYLEYAEWASLPTGWGPEYRLPSHRFAASPDTLKGWNFEGLVMCTPTPAAGGFPVSSEIFGYCIDSSCLRRRAWPSGVYPQHWLGKGDLLVVVELTNPSAEVIAATLPAGTRFVGPSAAYADGYLSGDLTFNLAPGSKTRLGIFLASSDPLLQKGAPAGAAYTLGGLASDAGLRNLMAMQPTPQTAPWWPDAQHWALWEITFGRGSLTTRQLELLELMRTTPATIGNNAELVAMLQEFLGSLSYAWYTFPSPSELLESSP